MSLNLSDFTRGAEAIKAAAKGGGKGGGFAHQIKWEVGEEKFVQFLLPIELSPIVQIHEWINCGTRDNGTTDWGFFLSRTDPVIGEDSDPLTEKGSKATKRTMSVAVELEAEVAQNGRGRARPKGFTVLTNTYDRKTDDGTEEVTAPVVGYVSQASGNFFNNLVAFDESGEFEGTVFKIKRVDDKTYTFTPYLDMDVDLSNLFDYIDGVSYLSRDEDTWSELEPLLDSDSDEDRVLAIATAFLERRLNELADYDEYVAKTDHLEEIVDKYDKSKKSNGGGKKERPQRSTQRAARTSDDSDSGDDADGGEDKAAAREARFAEIKAKAAAARKK